MATNSSLHTPYIVLSGTLLVGLAFFFLMIQPLFNEIRRTQEEISTQGGRLRQRQDFLSTIDRKLAILQTQSVHEERLAVMLPTTERMEDVLRVLHQSAGVSGLVVRSIDNQSQESQGRFNAQRARGEVTDIPSGLTVLSLSIDYSGTYQQLRAMLKELEKSPRLMDVTAAQISRGAQTPDQVSGQLGVQLYVQEQPSVTAL